MSAEPAVPPEPPADPATPASRPRPAAHAGPARPARPAGPAPARTPATAAGPAPARTPATAAGPAPAPFCDDDGAPIDTSALWDPLSGPPDGEDAWLADVAAEVAADYLDAREADARTPAAAREALAPGFTHKDAEPGAGGSPPAGRWTPWNRVRSWPGSLRTRGTRASPP